MEGLQIMGLVFKVGHRQHTPLDRVQSSCLVGGTRKLPSIDRVYICIVLPTLAGPSEDALEWAARWDGLEATIISLVSIVPDLDRSMASQMIARRLIG